MSDNNKDWSFGGSWKIPTEHSMFENHIAEKLPFNYLVQVIKQCYVIKTSAIVVSGYVEIFLGEQMILKVDETSDYVHYFESEKCGEVEFTMKWSDNCEMTIHYLDIKPFQKDDVTMEELID